MKYFLDFEFLEGFKKPISWLPTISNFNKPYHYIQMVSVGIECEDGRTYYAISNEFEPDDANEWVQENIFVRLLKEHTESLQGVRQQLTINAINGRSLESGMRKLQAWVGKSNKQIATEIIDFVYRFDFSTGGYTDTALQTNIARVTPIEFYAHFADYDWVLFCSLFGDMSNLPKGFPQYCKDLKQMLDELVANKSCKDLGIYMKADIPVRDDVIDFETKLNLVMQLPDYPKQLNEHNALADAKWDRKLYDFILSHTGHK